jgi:hypothetical protein
MGGLAEEYITKLGCEKYFILSTAGGALTLFQDSSKALKAVLFFRVPQVFQWIH